MSVYNDERFIAESMESILAQEGPEWEFVIVDDAGTDNSSAILDSYTDRRITLIRHTVNRGLAASLNHGLLYCRGRYIARQDGDDISEPGRIRKQAAFLEQRPDIAYVGTGLTVIDEEGRRGRTYMYSDRPEYMRECIQRLNVPLCHPTLMFRREALLAVAGYDELFKKSEDYDLHTRLLARFNASSIREPLVRLRQRGQSMQSGDSSGECLKYVLFAYARQLAEPEYGSLPRNAELLLLSEITEWFQRGPLGRCWTASIKRRTALESFVQGRRWRGLVGLARAISQDPAWLADFTLHGQRILLTPTMHRELEAIIDRVLGALAPFPTGAVQIRQFSNLNES
jgi:glycosyltransferase EpsE